jgi:predicted nucleotidyltransferase
VALRRLVVRLVPYLQHPALVWPLVLVYRLAVWAAVRSVRRMPGVVAVYLSGSLARGEAVWGLSDIDLKVIVDGPEDHALAHRLRERLRRLAVLLPILGSYREKGVYFTTTLAGLARRYPMVLHLFDRDFYPDRLLWGAAPLAAERLPPAEESDRLLSYLWKAKFWLEKVIVYAEEPRLVRLQRLYLAAKAVSSCARMLTLVEPGNREANGRRDPIAVLREAIDPATGPTLEALIRARASLFRGCDLEPEATFPVVMEAIGAVVRAVHDRLAATATGAAPAIAPVIAGDGWRPAEADIAEWRRALAAATPDDCTIELLPPALVGVGAVDLDHAGRPVLLVRSPRRIGYRTLLGLRRLWRERLAGRALVVIADNPDFLFPVHTEMLEHWLLSAVEDPHLAAAADLDGAGLGGVPAELALRRLADQLGETSLLVADPATRRLSDPALGDLLRLGLRNLALLSALRAGAFELACDLGAATARLERDGWLGSGQGAALAAAVERQPAAALPTLGKLAAALAAGVPTAVPAPPSSGDEAERTAVTVVVITRNRAEQLRRCLAALAGQIRPPDELLIVDNGSTDHTREVVASYPGVPRPRYLHEAAVGYGRARNAGVAAATGDVVAFIDDDAVATPGWLATLVRPFARDPEIAIVGGSIRTLVEDRSDPVYRYHLASEGNGPC